MRCNKEGHAGQPSLSADSTQVNSNVIHSHKLLYLSWVRTDLSWGRSMRESYSHTPTTHVAPLCINFGSGPAGSLRHFVTDLSQRVCETSLQLWGNEMVLPDVCIFNIYIYIYICTCISPDLYIYRERERYMYMYIYLSLPCKFEATEWFCQTCIYLIYIYICIYVWKCVCICLHMYIYIYVYIYI